MLNKTWGLFASGWGSGESRSRECASYLGDRQSASRGQRAPRYLHLRKIPFGSRRGCTLWLAEYKMAPGNGYRHQILAFFSNPIVACALEICRLGDMLFCLVLRIEKSVLSSPTLFALRYLSQAKSSKEKEDFLNTITIKTFAHTEPLLSTLNANFLDYNPNQLKYLNHSCFSWIPPPPPPVYLIPHFPPVRWVLVFPNPLKKKQKIQILLPHVLTDMTFSQYPFDSAYLEDWRIPPPPPPYSLLFKIRSSIQRLSLASGVFFYFRSSESR